MSTTATTQSASTLFFWHHAHQTPGLSHSANVDKCPDFTGEGDTPEMMELDSRNEFQGDQLHQQQSGDLLSQQALQESQMAPRCKNEVMPHQTSNLCYRKVFNGGIYISTSPRTALDADLLADHLRQACEDRVTCDCLVGHSPGGREEIFRLIMAGLHLIFSASVSW